MLINYFLIIICILIERVIILCNQEFGMWKFWATKTLNIKEEYKA